MLQKKNALLANGHAKPNGYCKSINAHDDLFLPQPTEATVAATTGKPNGSTTLTNGHANGLKNGYKPLANGNGNVNAATPVENGGNSVHSKTKLTNGYGNGNVNGYATKLLDDVSQELTHRKTPK